MVSIRDVAQFAGVSPASVSRILNNDVTFSINTNTRQRVITIAHNLHYDKDLTPRGPRSINKLLTIGLILRYDLNTEMQDPYFHNIHEGILEEAEKWRFNIELIFMMHDKNKDWSKIKNYGAIIIIGELSQDVLNRIKGINKRVIIVDADVDDPDCSYICNDFSDKVRSICDYLYKLGHRNIAYIGGRPSLVDMQGKTKYLERDSRKESYETWMHAHNLFRYCRSLTVGWGNENGLIAGRELLKWTSVPSAIIVASDPMAIGLYRALKEQKIKIPEDISIISFDDVDINKYLTPSLSSVYIDSFEMGKIAVRTARNMIIEPNNTAVTIIVHSKLEVRESIKKTQ